MQFRTEVKMARCEREVSYDDAILMMGSCFADNIGCRLKRLKFNVLTNPYGVLFNPESIRLLLQRTIDGVEFSSADLFEHEGVWNSFLLHSEFASLSSIEFLQKANLALQNAREKLISANMLFITWGTAWVYRLVDGGVVANCHKQTSSLFLRERLSVEAIVKSYAALLQSLWERNEALRIVLTVSPIRHWKDGAHGNQLSKSVLLLAAEELVQRYPDKVYYFPSYEIMMDDLRDYRFYASDMLHPNEQAIQYIWELFESTFFTTETQKMSVQVGRIMQAVEHRPFNPQSLPYQRFVEQTLSIMDEVEGKLSSLDFSQERQILMSSLK